MTEPSLDERPPSAEREHPPFRMRDRRRRLLPDLSPPTLEELRWAARQRRLRRDGFIPEPRRALHAPPDGGEDAAVTATVQEPDVIELADVLEPDLLEPDLLEPVAEPTDVIELPERPVVLPDPEPVVETAPQPAIYVEPAAAPIAEPPVELHIETSPAAERAAEASPDDVFDGTPPLVSHILVVREPAPVESGRIAILDEEAGDLATITRLVPLPDEAVADTQIDFPPREDKLYLEDLEDLEEHVEPELATKVDGRPVPLYWRLLRLRYTRPNGWLRALFFEGAVAIAVVLVLAEVASVWTIVVLPFVVAVVVKANDVLAGSLRRSYRQVRRR